MAVSAPVRRSVVSRLPVRLAVFAVLVAALVGILSLTGLLAKLRQQLPGLGSPAISYQTLPATRGELVVSVTATGPVAAKTSIALSFKASGKLAQLEVGVG